MKVFFSVVLLFVSIACFGGNQLDEGGHTFRQCQSWLKKQKIGGANCKSTCTSFAMGSFMPFCASNCEKLCKGTDKDDKKSILFMLSKLYLLTDAEYRLIKDDPKKAWEANQGTI